MNEVALQRMAVEYGLSPDILDTDNKTYIVMEDLEAMHLADYYGESIDDIPDHLKREIWNILWTLYSCCNIEYVDVTPYNFIEKAGKLWIIDYGHARETGEGEMNEWLHKVLTNESMTLTEWNADFA